MALGAGNAVDLRVVPRSIRGQVKLQVLGLRAQVVEGEDESSFGRLYMGMVPATIRGGTSEVQRNVIATRGLGLPRG